MSERHVSAVVLLSETTSVLTQQAMTEAIAAQTRRPQRVVVVGPTTVSDEVRDRLDRDLAAGTVHEVLTTSAAVGRSGAVREALELLDRREDAAGADDEAGGDDDDGDAPASGRPEEDADEEHAGDRSWGRRAADVDREAVERRRTQQAEDLALIPQRLRTDRRTGRRAGAGPGSQDESWLWFLVDGAPPGRHALSRQLEIVAASPNTAVVGSKRVRYSDNAEAAPDETGPGTADDADELVDVGLTLTHGGRIVTGVEPGEIDQGQADWRHDVLAVALPGMLIRQRSLRGIGGLDPDLPSPWAEIDLCRRVWRSGERVAVQSGARVLFPDPTRPRRERLRIQRTGQLLVLLKHRSVLMAVLMIVLSPLTTLVRMVAALAASVPRRAVMELRAWAAALAVAARVIARGRRERRGARVPAGRLAPLYLPRGEGLRRRAGDVWTRLFADDDRRRRIRRTTWGIAGTHHGADDADYGRHVVWTVVVALLSAVLGLLALRSLFGRGDLSGPALLPVPDDWRETWQAAWSSWVPGGLGARGPGDALTRLLGHVPVSGSLLIETIVFTALPLSALCAWWAAGAITRAVGARLVLAVTWALAPSLLSALSGGSWSLLLVHVLAPLLALAVGRAIGLPHKTSQASIPAAAVGGLLLLVIGAVQPVLVLLAALALALLAPAVPGRRLRLLWVLLPSLALHAPYLAVYAGHPRTLLSVAGTVPLPDQASGRDLLMLWPTPPGVTQTLAPHVGAALASWLPALAVAPVVIAALASTVLAGAAGRVGRFSVLLAAAGLATVLLARATPTVVVEGRLSAPALHALLDLTLLALCIGAAASFDALARRETADSRPRRLLTTVVGAVVAASCLTVVVGWSVLLPERLQLDRVASGEIPAAAADQGRTDARTRVLVLEQAEDGSVGASLVVHGGQSILQQSAITSAREVATVRAGEAVDGDPGSTALRESVARIVSTGAAEEDGRASPLAVGYVIVPGDSDEHTDLVSALDASTSLEQVTSGDSGGMWRVIDAAPRAHITGGDEPVALASDVIEVHDRVSAEDGERTLVLGERYDSGWRASAGGTELDPVPVDGWAQGFTLPADAGGEIDVHREQPWRPLWQVMLYATVAMTLLIAVPWRPRSRTPEDLYG